VKNRDKKKKAIEHIRFFGPEYGECRVPGAWVGHVLHVLGGLLSVGVMGCDGDEGML
jgi:hypothetical protein